MSHVTGRMVQIGTLLTAALLMTEIMAMKRVQSSLTEYIPDVLIEEIIKPIIDDRIAVVRFAATSKTARRILSPLLSAIRIFSLWTPIRVIPKLIQHFADNIKSSHLMQYFAMSVKPSEAAHLFTRLLQSTAYCKIRGGKATRKSRSGSLLSGHEVAASVSLLIKTIHRPEIAAAASVLLRCPQGFLKQNIPEVPLPTLDHIPEIVTKTILRIRIFAERDDSELMNILLSRIPKPFDQIYIAHGVLIDKLLYKEKNRKKLCDEIFKDPDNVLMALSGVGVRFDIDDFFAKGDIPIESLNDIVPFLTVRDPLDALALFKRYLRDGKIPYAIALMKTLPYQTLMCTYPNLFAWTILNDPAVPPIELMEAVVKQPFILGLHDKLNKSGAEQELLDAALQLKTDLLNTKSTQ